MFEYAALGEPLELEGMKDFERRIAQAGRAGWRHLHTIVLPETETLEPGLMAIMERKVPNFLKCGDVWFNPESVSAIRVATPTTFTVPYVMLLVGGSCLGSVPLDTEDARAILKHFDIPYPEAEKSD